MSKRQQFLSGPEEEELRLLGNRIRLARIRRSLTQAELAERTGFHRSTLVDLEAGKPGVSIGVMVSVLSALGLQGRLAEVLQKDELGEELEMGARKRARGSSDVADF
ncbi:helix-turn-helix domain-containing protein [Acidisoma cellulosilytica]|uniref:Helix-turn-helix domain-containing protein n=1 Tax=Acidisoma cellulosilyticum TaxID=2802395 RepID=A0A964E5M0_9PROT|nr:helix-turn-helix domain-containing protein [Acidisoma cellulosilyticum]MCB8882659.1 helix-turn-helix domain-containing protein [Acidisoma cellulosilyticum]